MIRYNEIANNWISGMNPDDQGFPTTNLTGDFVVCDCADCVVAVRDGLGTNRSEVQNLLNQERSANA